jgi:selenocysteine-specific elongation factor
MVLDPFPPVRGRRTARRLLALAALERPAPEAALRALLADAPDGADLARFALGWNLPPAVAEHLRAAPGVHPVGGAGGIRLFAQERWQALRLAVAEALGAEHRDRPDVLGPDAGRLRRQIAADLSPEAFEGLLTELLAEGRVCRRGAWWYLPGHEVSLALGEERLWGRIRPLLEAAPYQPPRVRDIARGLELEEGQVRGLLRHLVGRGDLFLVAQDHYLLRQAVYELAAVARELAEGEGEVRAAEFRDRIGTGRKLAIQILEFFDRVGFTRRVGDAHRLRRPGLLPGDAPA